MLKHVKMLITLTPHVFRGWEKGYPWFIGVVWLWVQNLTFSLSEKMCWLNSVSRIILGLSFYTLSFVTFTGFRTLINNAELMKFMDCV